MITSLRRAAFAPVAGTLLTGLLTGLLAGCADEPVALSAPCAVVLDGSGSGTELDVEKLMKKHLATYLSEQGCGTLTYSPITGSSASSRCNEPTADLSPPSPPGGNVGEIRRRALVTALRSAAGMLECAKAEEKRASQGSDVLGGISRAVGVMPGGQGPRRILVISDFAQTDSTMNLYRDKRLGDREHRAELIARLNADARVPDLSGSQVVAYGFGAGFSPNPDRVDLLRAFWNELLTGPAKGTPLETRA
ncbi:hypothetical protein [Spongiactinospora sp. TRM90649]|uniref:hypothetical protein n=1 Tax=Spongiactinospora sp. TRM90649 TaxID=3031114 RepID=UPI0023F922ED|nr:hypothetical protein [Spongiactinospora sp. TRM90649]MDF5757497.1 hypothetical protein [Spongiactinospora sp. TRM90649]